MLTKVWSFGKNPLECVVIISICNEHIRVFLLQFFDGLLEMIIVGSREVVKSFQAVKFVVGIGIVGLKSSKIDWKTTYWDISRDNHASSAITNNSLQQQALTLEDRPRTSDIM